jgi:hypothetical protein
MTGCELGDLDRSPVNEYPPKKQRRPRRLRQGRRPPLRITDILAWADEYHKLTGRWPRPGDPPKGLPLVETWGAINSALGAGLRGLPGGDSLARLLQVHRGVRNKHNLPRLTPEQILAWADEYHRLTGDWPRQDSPPTGLPVWDTWATIHGALSRGLRGLPGGSSLPRLLEEHRGVRNVSNLPPLTVEQVLAWAEEHRRLTGRWPRKHSTTEGLPEGEKWSAISTALRNGVRGLPGGSSLARLLLKQHGVPKWDVPPPLTVDQILAWADAFHEAHGRKPYISDGLIPEAPAPGETWGRVDVALSQGWRGLPGGSSLSQLLAEHRNFTEALTVERILGWADECHQLSGRWPRVDGPPTGLPPGETWAAIGSALNGGYRGLPGGGSLPRLLQEHRGVPNKQNLPVLTVAGILAWADEYHRLTGDWPRVQDPPTGLPAGESWPAINASLGKGFRGLPGGSSLPQLLEEHRGVRNKLKPPPLTVEQVLAWADAYHKLTGRWPRADHPPTGLPAGETWGTVNDALSRGLRGLSGGTSLATLLQERRGVRNKQGLPPMTVKGILAWADAHHRLTGRWPRTDSPPEGLPAGETWCAVQSALNSGIRGLPGGSSLATLLQKHRGVRNTGALPPLTVEAILSWADAFRDAKGRWPRVCDKENPAAPTPGETWHRLDVALRQGLRGLPGGTSVTQLLAEHRGVAVPLTVVRILAWADAHHQATGGWPTAHSGVVPGTQGETWGKVDNCLRMGCRGLPKGGSLPRLLAEHRGRVPRRNRPNPAPCRAPAPL